MNKRLFPILFILIVFLGAFFRLYHLDTNPPSLFSDEVDAGYQAKVFLENQTDYFGNSWPVHFQSFADWRTPILIYSTALSFKFFGTSAFAVRFPSAFFGILCLPALYLLIKKLTKNKHLALSGMAILAFSPWHIHYSRVAFELTTMLFFLIMGLERLISYTQTKKTKLFFQSLFFLLLSTYSYSTAKLFIVFILLLFLAIFKTKLIKPLLSKKNYLSFAVLILLALPMVLSTLKGESGYRFSYINIFTDPTTSQQIDRDREIVAVQVSGEKTLALETPLLAKIYYNKPLSWGKTFLKNYFSSFSTEFLFLKGDQNLRHSFSTVGLLLYPELFLILLGLVKILSSKPNKKEKLLLGLLILAPIPFSLTRDSPGPHASRLIITLPLLIILEVYGLAYLWKKIKQKTLFFSALAISLFFFWSIFWQHYFYQYPHLSERVFHAGLKEAVLSSLQKEVDYEKIYFSDKQEPFLPFFLFWGPHQKTIEGLSLSPVENANFAGQAIDKFNFGRLNLGSAADSPERFFSSKNLYILGQYDIPPEIMENNPKIKVIKEIKLPYSDQIIYYLVTGV